MAHAVVLAGRVRAIILGAEMVRIRPTARLDSPQGRGIMSKPHRDIEAAALDRRKRYRLPRNLDEVEWNVIMRDGSMSETDEDVENAIAYLEGAADWIFSPDDFHPFGPFAETRLALCALTRADQVLRDSDYGAVGYYLEAAALLRDGWRP